MEGAASANARRKEKRPRAGALDWCVSTRFPLEATKLIDHFHHGGELLVFRERAVAIGET